MYAIRSNTVRYPERFENDFKGGQPGCFDPFSSSVNGVPGYPDRFWIHFYGKNKFKLSVYLQSLLYLELFDLLLFSMLFFWCKTIFRQIYVGNFAKFGRSRTPNLMQERPFGSSK